MFPGRVGAVATTLVLLASTAGVTLGQTSTSCVQVVYATSSTCPCNRASIIFALEGETTIAANTVDLAVVVDGSGSVSPSDFELEKEFAKNLTASFAERNLFGNGGTASYVQFSSGVISSGSFDTLESFNTFVDGDVANRGGTNIPLGMEEARRLLNDSRPWTAAFMIVLTDGNTVGDPEVTADLARAEGVTVFAVGVGSGVSDETLFEIAGNSSNVFDISSFGQLNDALVDILDATVGDVIACPSTGANITLDLAGTVTDADSAKDISGNTVTFMASDLESNPTEFRVDLDVCGLAAGTNLISNISYEDDQNNTPDLSELLNLEVSSSVCDDPHLVGLAGQTIDWSGVDGGWYVILSAEEKQTYITVRVTAPLPLEFPDRQLITGVAIFEGEHSLVIEVEDPYAATPKGCLDRSDSRPCLADGALRILVDGQPSKNLAGPAHEVVLPSGTKVSASNLPVQCRPFGGDKIWAAEFARIAAGRRNLRSAPETFDEWIVGGVTVAAPAWCVKYIKDNGGIEGLMATASSHAVFRIETPFLTARLNVGLNYQGGETIHDGRTLPELEFWQMNLGLERLKSRPTTKLGGLLGETAEPVFDEYGEPVMSGLEALRGQIEDYRVLEPCDTYSAQQ